jgi:hypothetical protein
MRRAPCPLVTRRGAAAEENVLDWLLLTVGSLSSKAHRLETLSQGLRAFGHVEGKNISIDRRAAAYVDNILKGQKAC